MKILRYSAEGEARWGVVEGEEVLDAVDPFESGGRAAATGHVGKLADTRLLAPVEPSKIVAIGLNYRAHAAEFDKELPDEPMIFLKPSTAVIGPGDDIVYPSHMTRRVDYEGELAVVIGRRAKDVPTGDAARFILGYTCINDVTARDLQKLDVQFTRAKGFDTFAPVGPWIETELDPVDVRITSRLNGEVRQDTSTADMIFNVFELVSFVSHAMTLLPGDVIATGTPSGVGKMKPGDTVEVTVEGIGTLTNRVVGGGEELRRPFFEK